MCASSSTVLRMSVTSEYLRSAGKSSFNYTHTTRKPYVDRRATETVFVDVEAQNPKIKNVPPACRPRLIGTCAPEHIVMPVVSPSSRPSDTPHSDSVEADLGQVVWPLMSVSSGPCYRSEENFPRVWIAIRNRVFLHL